MRSLLTAVMLFFLLNIPCLAQQDSVPVERSLVHRLTRRKPMIAAGLVLNSAGILYTGYKWWWQGNYHPFDIKYEGYFNNYSLGVDKTGHFYISHLYFHAIHDVMKWGGYSDKSALITAVAIPAFYAITIEMADGFTTYHFSLDDLGANMLGIGLGVLQKKYRAANLFRIKWSYYPSAFAPWRDANLSLSDDYDGHIYWLSMDVHHMLPLKARRYWPKWLNLAVGYGVQGASFGATGPMERKFVFGLDYNLSNINFKNKELTLIKNLLDQFKFPAPGLRKTGKNPVQIKPFILN